MAGSEPGVTQQQQRRRAQCPTPLGPLPVVRSQAAAGVACECEERCRLRRSRVREAVSPPRAAAADAVPERPAAAGAISLANTRHARSATWRQLASRIATRMVACQWQRLMVRRSGMHGSRGLHARDGWGVGMDSEAVGGAQGAEHGEGVDNTAGQPGVDGTRWALHVHVHVGRAMQGAPVRMPSS